MHMYMHMHIHMHIPVHMHMYMHMLMHMQGKGLGSLPKASGLELQALLIHLSGFVPEVAACALILGLRVGQRSAMMYMYMHMHIRMHMHMHTSMLMHTHMNMHMHMHMQAWASIGSHWQA